LHGVTKSYGEQVIFKDATAQVLRGDKIAFVGANGKGKSTLLRIIYGSEPHGGTVEPGWNVETSFFAQHQLEALNLQRDLLNELGTVDADYTEAELRTVLGCFLFTGDEVFKKIKVLSGGEKSRVALAKTLLTRANFLLLDEPTNHLDMFSTSVLAEALNNYKGTCVIVSHDRTFVSNVANKIWWIEQGILREYPGTFDEWNEWMSRRGPISEVIPKTTVSAPSANAIQTGSESENQKKTGKNTLNRLEQQIAELEEQLKNCHSRQQAIETDMALPEIASNYEKLAALTANLETLKKETAALQAQLDEVMEQWMAAQ
jgi:ATP-binding cassette subfamily F protein 3